MQATRTVLKMEWMGRQERADGHSDARSVGIKIDTAANEAKNESECANESADLKLIQCARNRDAQADKWMEKGKH